jgi:hypothetical protein
VRGAITTSEKGVLVKALIFVYKKSAQFTNSGQQPVRRFEPGTTTTFDAAKVALPVGGSSVLDEGIYVVFTDSEKEPPEINATGREGTDYDLIEAASKDKWPVPKATGEQLSRIEAAFPTLSVAQLNKFSADDILGV